MPHDQLRQAHSQAMNDSTRAQLARLRQQLIDTYDRSKRTRKRRDRRRRAKEQPPAATTRPER